MGDETKWVLGIIGVILTAIIGAFRNLSNKQSAGDKALHDKIEDVKEKYVRRDDLDKHINRVDESVKELKREMRENHKAMMEALEPKRR